MAALKNKVSIRNVFLLLWTAFKLLTYMYNSFFDIPHDSYSSCYNKKYKNTLV